MAVLSLQVAAGADDAHEKDDGSGFSRTSNAVILSAHTVATSRYNGGFRFQNVTIAQGTNILRAWLIPYIDVTTADDANFDILAEDVDNAASFATTPDVTSRTRTTASVLWNESSLGIGFVASPNIASVIQEIIDRALWVSGNALVILGDGRSDVSYLFYVNAYDNVSAQACKLTIKTGTPTAPALGLRNHQQQRNVRFAPFL